jgi:hypothetical protein
VKPPPLQQAEQTFFPDPANDRLLAMLMALAAEFWVMSDRMRAMETLLAERGVLRPDDLDRYVPDAATEQAIAAERQAFVKQLMAPVIGREASRSVPPSLEEGLKK